MLTLNRRNILKLPALAAAPYIAQAVNQVDPEAIASMLLIGFIGTSDSAAGAQQTAAHLAKDRIGGVCFLGHNTKNKADIERLTKLFHEAGGKTLPLIAVDQEGGAVQRLGRKSGYKDFPRANFVANKSSPHEAALLYAKLAEQIKSAGFNLNLGPVVDLGIEPNNPVVYQWGRTFGDNGATVANYARAFIESHRNLGVLTALKHFPGHGSTLVDSHSSPVDLTSTWRADELTPFRLLAQGNDIDIVMSGHLSHRNLTGGIPATLSRQAVGILRKDLSYDGVIMTDDLDMKAIRSSYRLADAAVKAIAAGHDLILLSNSLNPDPMLPQRMIAAIQDAVADGVISANSIHESAERISMLKNNLRSGPAA